MGLTTANFPPVEPAEFMNQPYRERTKVLARHWVDHGFGAPTMCSAATPPGAGAHGMCGYNAANFALRRLEHGDRVAAGDVAREQRA